MAEAARAESQPAEYVVDARDVYFRWPGTTEWVLEGVTLQVSRGCFVGIIGPNGGGKTTFLRLILGELRPTRGQILVFGRPPHRLGRLRSRIGYVPQRPEIRPDFPLSVFEAVIMGGFSNLRPFMPVPASLRQKAIQALEYVGLADLAHRPLCKLSGGQQQRVMIARALVNDPEMLLLDEPTVGVDAGTQESFFNMLLSLRQRFRLTIIMVSHEVTQLRTFADQLVCLARRLHWHKPAEKVDQRELEAAVRCELADYMAFHQRMSQHPQEGSHQ